MQFAVWSFAILTLAAHAATWDDQMFAADRYRSAGDYRQAAAAYQSALAEAKGDRQQAITANNLAALYAEQGRAADARRLYRQALDIWQRTLEPNAPEIGTTMNNLGALYAAGKHYRDAEYYYRQALAIQAQPDTLNNLAELYRAQGRYTDAEKLYRQLIETLPLDNPTRGTAFNNLGELCRRQGRAAEAADYYQRALEVWDRSLGPDHPYRATTLRNLSALNSKGKGSAATAFR